MTVNYIGSKTTALDLRATAITAKMTNYAMLDGIKLEVPIDDFRTWVQRTGVPFSTLVDTSSGTVDDITRVYGDSRVTIVKYEGRLETYRLTVTEVQKESIRSGKSFTKYYLVIMGSLHKNYFGGSNFSRFCWRYLQAEITNLCAKLDLIEEDVKISNLEVGLNVEIPCSVLTLINDIVVYKGKPFNHFDSKNLISLGIYCLQSQNKIKVYAKSEQYNIPKNLMRFEVAFKKMQRLTELGIRTLSDLRDREKIKGLDKILISAWDAVIMYDHKIDVNHPSITPLQKELLLNGRNPKFWERLTLMGGRSYSKYRVPFTQLVSQWGDRLQEQIRGLIEAEWEKNFINENYTILPLW